MTKVLLISTVICVISLLLYSHFSATPDIPRGTVILICGASSGIGEELAYQAADTGAILVLAARSEDKLLKVRETALARGAQEVVVIPCDFSDVVGSSVVINKTVELFGKLDYLVLNHAGVPLGPFLAAKSMQDPAFIEKIFRVNLFSFIELALHGLPHLEASLGHLFVTSSTFAEMPHNYGMALYSSTKHAMNGFFYSLQQELLAKESPVSLTIGSLGLIATHDMEDLWKNDTLPINLISGTLDKTAQGILEAYTTRPRTWTYPKGPTYFMRMMWYFNPWYQEMTVNQNKQPGSSGRGYKPYVEKFNEKIQIAAKNRFSTGYNEEMPLK